jgi:hypothetical protein
MTDPTDDPAFVESMLIPVGDTKWTALELYLLGQAVVTWVSVVAQLGHSSPADSLDYVRGNGNPWDEYLRDFIAWTSNREHLSPGCEERLRQDNELTGWHRHRMERLNAAIAGSAPKRPA